MQKTPFSVCPECIPKMTSVSLKPTLSIIRTRVCSLKLKGDICLMRGTYFKTKVGFCCCWKSYVSRTQAEEVPGQGSQIFHALSHTAYTVLEYSGIYLRVQHAHSIPRKTHRVMKSPEYFWPWQSELWWNWRTENATAFSDTGGLGDAQTNAWAELGH